MLDPFPELWVQAALASGWPTLHLVADDEAIVEGARARIEAILGPLPQADIIEPWDHDEPDWELRIDLPALSAAQWAAVRSAVPGARLVPGVREGSRAADDEGLRHTEVLEAGGLVATLHLDEDGPLPPDLARAGGADRAIEELERELSHAVRRVDPALGFRSDRGPDTVLPVVHRSTGRFGVQLAFDASAFEGTDAAERRAELLAAVADVARSRADHPLVRLAPDPTWDAPMGGLLLTVWIIAPAVPALPGDDDIGAGLSGRLEALTADPGQLEELELQVVPVGPGAHDRVAERVSAVLADGWPVHGAVPRWLRAGGRWAFCPVWRVLATELDPRLVALLPTLAALDGVAAVRVVPGEPAGLGDTWRTAQPAWTWGPLRCALRVRDALADRDRLPEIGDRPRRPRDAAVEVQVFAGLVAAEGAAGLLPGAPGPGRAIVDSSGREGLELGFDARSFREEPLRAALRAVAAAGHEDLAPVFHYAHRHDRTVVRLWYRSDRADPPRWR